jgi:hypothetical protein
MTVELRGNQLLLEGRKLGWTTTLANGEKAFISPRRRSRHYFRIFKGWGLSKEVLRFLHDNDVKWIQLRIGKAEMLMSELGDWFIYAQDYYKPPFEPQLVLPEKYMKKKQVTLAELPERLY